MSKKKKRRNRKKNNVLIPSGKNKWMKLWEKAPILCMALVTMAVVAVMIVAFVIRKRREYRNTIAEENVFYDGIYISGVPVGGMTMNEARAAVTKKLDDQLSWNMQVDLGGELYQVENPFSWSLDEVLTQAFAVGHTGTDSERMKDISTLQANGLHLEATMEAGLANAADMAAVLADGYDITPVNATIESYDESTGIVFTDGVTGRYVNREDLAQKIQTALDEKSYDTLITAEVQTVPPEITKENAGQHYVKLSEFTSEVSVNKEDRNHNVALASDTISGSILAPGEEFSMNALIGNTTEEQGYRQAATYQKGEIVPEFGGGVCQVSSTVYNAVVYAGLNTTERHCHSMTVNYVELGEDAMLSYPYSDLKFENNTSGSVLLICKADGPKVTCTIYGIPVLSPGMTLDMESYIKEEYPRPETEYVQDPDLKKGTEEYWTYGKKGYYVITELVTYQNGEEISRELLHTSTYQAKAPVVHVGTGE